VDSGAATPGEIVLLFAAGTDAEWYEDELRRAGLPTYRATGKGYFGQQQVVDLLMYLRLLQNRYDDTALLSVLASPSSASRTTRSRSCAGSRRGGRSSPASSTPCRRGSPSATSA
jgi:ATP-dependent exoDNAse (exonuclease V) beta subunit